MSTTFKLHGYYRSSCSYRVRIVMAQKSIPYTYVPVHLVKDGGEQFKDAYVQHNPMSEVPSLEIVDASNETIVSIGQSMAIVEFLEEQFPEPAMLPKDPIQRARVRQLAETINTSIQPIQNLRVMRRIMEQFEVERDVAVAWNHYWIDRGFQGLEQLLVQTAGIYAFGDHVTLADAFLVPQHYNAVRFKVDMSKYPTIARVCEAAHQLPAFQQAAPDAQPDAV